MERLGESSLGVSEENRSDDDGDPSMPVSITNGVQLTYWSKECLGGKIQSPFLHSYIQYAPGISGARITIKNRTWPS